MKFERTALVISATDLTAILDEAILLTSQENWPGTSWMTELGEPVWSGVGTRDWSEIYQPLVRLLYRVGFLGICAAHQGPPTFFLDKPEYAERSGNLESAAGFMIHPAFRVTLDVKEV